MSNSAFKPQVIIRNIGNYLILASVISERGNGTKGYKSATEINKWIKDELSLDKELPSSFLYPTLVALTSGPLPILKIDKNKKYFLNPKLREEKYSDELAIVFDEINEIAGLFQSVSDILSEAGNANIRTLPSSN